MKFHFSKIAPIAAVAFLVIAVCIIVYSANSNESSDIRSIATNESTTKKFSTSRHANSADLQHHFHFNKRSSTGSDIIDRVAHGQTIHQRERLKQALTKVNQHADFSTREREKAAQALSSYYAELDRKNALQEDITAHHETENLSTELLLDIIFEDALSEGLQ